MYIYILMYQSYRNTLRQEVSTRFRLSSKLYAVASLIYFIKITIIIYYSECFVMFTTNQQFYDILSVISEEECVEINLPYFQYNVTTIDNECVICTELFVQNEDVRQFGCGHIFHKNCIDRWLRLNPC